MRDTNKYQEGSKDHTCNKFSSVGSASQSSTRGLKHLECPQREGPRRENLFLVRLEDNHYIKKNKGARATRRGKG